MIVAGRRIEPRVVALAALPLSLLLIVGVAVVLWALVSGEPAAGSEPEGRIAFSGPSATRKDKLSSDLFVVDADGEHRSRLAQCDSVPSIQRDPSSSCSVRSFSWSPNGRRLGFLRGNLGGRSRAADLSLYVIGANGEGERRLAGCGKPRWPGCGDFFGSRPEWSPDGSRLIVPRAGILHVFDVDGGGHRRLTPACGSCFEMGPAWSPDGSKIVFSRHTQTPRQRVDLYTINPDGSQMTRISRLPGPTGYASWSPDGTRIAFNWWDEDEGRIYVMDADGSNLKVMWSGSNNGGATNPGVPSWSPDGTRIAYLVTPSVGVAYGAEVWTARPDGSGRRRLYRSGWGIQYWARPTWSPSGEFLSFAVGLGRNTEDSGIYVVRADGSNLRRLADTPSDAFWQPDP